MKKNIRNTICATCLLLVIALPALASDFRLAMASKPASENEILKVTLNEGTISVDKQTVNAGLIEIHAINGSNHEDHELVIIRTDLSPNNLPINHGKVDESRAGEIIGEIEEFPPGEARKAHFNLKAGNYVLICNVAEQESDGHFVNHYMEGMKVSLIVR